MTEKKLDASVYPSSPFVNRVDLQGEITAFTESTLNSAYVQATQSNRRKVIINFTDVNYLNSFGIGILITLLIRAHRDGIRIVGYGLNEHYRKIFEITRLDQVLPIFPNEETALASVERYDLPEREA